MKTIIEGIQFLICERKVLTANKATMYLLKINPNGKREYISSLYPTESEGIFRIDYNGSKGVLNLSLKKIEGIKI